MKEVDWKKILLAYIRHVRDFEGIDFLCGYGWTPNGLTDRELKALTNMAWIDLHPKLNDHSETVGGDDHN